MSRSYVAVAAPCSTARARSIARTQSEHSSVCDLASRCSALPAHRDREEQSKTTHDAGRRVVPSVAASVRRCLDALVALAGVAFAAGSAVEAVPASIAHASAGGLLRRAGGGLTPAHVEVHGAAGLGGRARSALQDVSAAVVQRSAVHPSCFTRGRVAAANVRLLRATAGLRGPAGAAVERPAATVGDFAAVQGRRADGESSAASGATLIGGSAAAAGRRS